MIYLLEASINEGQIALIVSAITAIALIIQVGDRLWKRSDKKEPKEHPFNCKYNQEVIQDIYNKFQLTLTLLTEVCQIIKTQTEVSKERSSFIFKEHERVIQELHKIQQDLNKQKPKKEAETD